MKAVIVDLQDSNAVVLRDDGRFEKIKNKNYSIGQEITLQSQVLHFPKQAVVAASAALVITACGGIGTYTWSNPISYVSLDINPSIAYSLNEFNRVIAVNGMNEEGTAVVDAIGDSLKNTDITTALTITVEQLSNDAYIDDTDTNYMIIGVYSDKDKKASDLLSTVDAFSASATDTCSITTVQVSKETKETADAYGITAGKMELINEITDVATDPKEVDPVALADLSVAQLEQTKAAAATGTSVSSAVASAVPATSNDSSDAAPAATPVDPTAVVSESKPEESVDSSSSKKDETVSSDKPADQTSDSNSPTQVTSADNNASSVSGSAANSSSVSADTTDHNGNGSSAKKDDTKSDDKNEKKDDSSDSSSTKGETVSSDKKDDSSSSSKTDETTSSEKKDEITEDDSSQTNTAPPEIIPAEDDLFWTLDRFNEGNMLS